MKKFLPFLLAIFLLSSCRQTEYITVPEIHTEYLHDSIEVHDTIERFNTVFTRGDTVFVHDSIKVRQTITVQKEHTVHDTIVNSEPLVALQQECDSLSDQNSLLQSTIDRYKTKISRKNLAIFLLSIFSAVCIILFLKRFFNGR